MNSSSITQSQRSDSAFSHDLENQIDQNIAAKHDFYTREEGERSVKDRHAEAISDFVGQLGFLNDSDVVAMQTSITPDRVFKMLDEKLISPDGSVAASTASSAPAQS